ncbi:MAG: hypothetical protein KDK36_19525 [Leptospiraceae bacterium]|nr:hypothetical protein [Leptospiraceae bacterium]
MKILIYIILISLISISNCKEGKEEKVNNNSSGQEEIKVENNSKKNGEENEETSILDIKEKYKIIEQSVLREEKYPLNCDVGENTLSFFYDKDELKKIIYKIGADHGYEKKNYYFWNGKVFFIFIEGGTWRFETEHTTIDTFYQKRYYIQNDQPIRCLEKEVEGKKDLEKRLTTLPNKEIKECSNQSEEFKNLFITIEDVKKAVKLKQYEKLCL